MTIPGADEPRPLTAQRLAYIMGQDAPAPYLIAQAKAAGYTIERRGPRRDTDADDLGNVFGVIVIESFIRNDEVAPGAPWMVNGWSRIIVPGVADTDALDAAWIVADHAALRRAAGLDI